MQHMREKFYGPEDIQAVGGRNRGAKEILFIRLVYDAVSTAEAIQTDFIWCGTMIQAGR
jgi:hypothetical protein